MSICECGQVSVPLGTVSVLVFGTIHGVTACGPSDRHWKDRAEKAEATIQRVRELCDDFEHEENLNGGIGRYAVVRVDRVRSALNGERDD